MSQTASDGKLPYEYSLLDAHATVTSCAIGLVCVATIAMMGARQTSVEDLHRMQAMQGRLAVEQPALQRDRGTFQNRQSHIVRPVILANR